ncbi:TIGR04076 family protein [Muribaculum intestinale]|uniref:TIGR04076 family protein n=1 Tax=Muribaculum intestinale TaxID=1796646 RepID=UPI002628F09F|nr:TIGR04076 family protein [Muribaculum intestinale]
MDRRHFCKIGALALGAFGAGALKGNAGVLSLADGGADRGLARGCRVTVIRRECYEDIQSLYLDDPETGPCRAFSTGEVLTFERGEGCPEGFCPRAWGAIELSVNAGAGCAGALGDVLTVACPDGSRPVIFRVELL